ASFGSSGSLFAQLSQRAPFDMFLSADMDYPAKLDQLGCVAPGTTFPYARGRIALWVVNASPLDLKRLGDDALTDPSVQRIAMANPRHAPYGRSAQAALKSLGIWDRVRDRLVLGESVSQAAQFVESGSAEIGILAYSLTRSESLKGKGRARLLPLESYHPMIQGGVILEWARDHAAAEAFRDFMLGPKGRKLLQQHGFLMPGE
ncbi:MAG TPA: molybdate ABC transporter substrate-binding protein, partial [Pirellulaceae bacterium]